MRIGLAFAVGATLVASAVVLAPVAATALPISVGATLSAPTAHPLIEQVQLQRRVGAGRVVAGRGAVRGGRFAGRRGGGGIGPAGAAAIGLGILGVAAAAAAANQQPQYYEPAPVYGPACGWERQPVYDRFGNYRGTRRVQVC